MKYTVIFFFALLGFAFGAEAHDADAHGTTALTGTSMTWNHTVTGSDPALAVTCAIVAGDADTIISSINYNGTALTKYASVRDYGGSELFSQLYLLAGPSTGTHAITVTFSTSLTAEIINCASTSFTGISQTAPVRFPYLFYTDTTTSTTDSVNCANAVSGDYIVGLGVVHAATITVGGSQTDIYHENAFNVGTNTSWGASYILQTTGSTLTWTQSPAGVASSACFALRPDTETLSTPTPDGWPMTNFGSVVSNITITGFSVGSCTNRLLVVNTAYYAGSSNRTTSSITFGGVNLTALAGASRTDGASGNHHVAELWYLKNPSNSTANIVATFSGTGVEGQIGARSFCFVDQTSTFGTPNTNGNLSAASPTVTITSNTGAVVVDSLYFDDGSSKALFPTGAQSWYNSSGGSTTSGSSQVKQGAASVAMTYTPNDPFTIVGVGINFNSGSPPAGNNNRLPLLGVGE